jgi:hypothetical protein
VLESASSGVTASPTLAIARILESRVAAHLHSPPRTILRI